ncbi:PRC-barrel domain-containing protein [Arthrobacter tumbae]|uniref:PRC-barrel domain-containing protein n=1 Tax=Arthrobacter tumbae TaxID=163874 RepID=UPI00195EB18B|nr:PRC-barrel domain-containing protein [Arthrobacter tumbae]MBM7781164.1 sporulation protein YlmC with PRC-barrel domain [Arthrobacter tumbae]
MATGETSKLIKLSDSDQTVAPEEDIRGLNVKDKDGDDLGKVDDLLIDDGENKIRFLEVASGGFLGIGEEKSFIPIDAITNIDENVHINQSRGHVAGAPTYNPELVDQTDYYEDVYGYYGYSPFWGAGYMYPALPPRSGRAL